MKKLRSLRLFNIAVFDLVTAFLGMLLLFWLLHRVYYPHLNLGSFIIAALVLTIPVGILFHVLLGINTQLNYTLGLSDKP